MASLTGSKQNLGSNSTGNVRVVARIRGLTNKEQGAGNRSLNPWISVSKPGGDASENVTLSFGDQSASQSSQLHYCYEPNEDNGVIFAKEIKPLIPGVFDGHSTSVVAYGAIGSGKTYTIQGSDENPGLATLAMDEIIQEAERLGRSVSVSFYEVHQEQAFDLINPKRPVISVLGDGQGRIQLKGLSQAPIKSTSEFCKIYRPRKPIQKNTSELPRRSHKGLIIHVTMPNDNSKASPRGKMNFIDFAGYEDPRKKLGGDGTKVVEINKRNKSLNALQKVILAVNANESLVPFRESIVTRMLQDSLGCADKVTLVACLNPTFCQDSISMASLASRTYEGLSRCNVASTKSVKTSNKVLGISSKSGIPKSTSASVKKPTASRTLFLKKKVGDATPSIKAKKLFDEASQSKTPMQATSVSSTALTVESSMLEESCSSTTEGTSLVAEKSCSDTPKEISVEGETTSPMSVVFEMEDATLNDASQVRDDEIRFVHNPVYNHCELISNNSAKASSLAKEGDIMDKENNSLSVNRLNTDASPPLSTRLQELSNSLKFLCSTPIPIDLAQEPNILSGGVVVGEKTDTEPKTPSFAPSTKVHEAYEITPREVSRTCFPATKVSLVQEYLRFINSASKEELKGLKGIGEKRASYILELREESPEPFKSLDDLKDIGLSAKQIKKMLSIK